METRAAIVVVVVVVVGEGEKFEVNVDERSLVVTLLPLRCRSPFAVRPFADCQRRLSNCFKLFQTVSNFEAAADNDDDCASTLLLWVVLLLRATAVPRTLRFVPFGPFGDVCVCRWLRMISCEMRTHDADGC